MAGIHIEKGKNYNIADGAEVTVTKFKAQKKVDITSTSTKNNILQNYKKVNADEYVNTITGELKNYEKNVIKPEKSVKRSMRQLEKILQNNFSGEDDEYFITFTTEEETKDINVIKSYFKSFLKQFKRYYRNQIKYAYVLEMQYMRESWHIHMIVKGIRRLSNKFVEKIWQRGITRTTKITDKYTDFEIDEEKAMNDPNGFSGKQSSYGIDRVINYITKYSSKEELPTGARAYSISRNLEKPERHKTTYAEIKKELDNEGYTMQDEYTSIIRSNETDNILNKIKKEKWHKLE